MSNLIDDPRYSQTAQEMLRTLLIRVTQTRRPITINHNGWQHTYDRDGRAFVPEADKNDPKS